MKRLLSSLTLTGCFLAAAITPNILNTQTVTAQTHNELFYTFYGQSIPLSLRRDVIAVSFHDTPDSSSRSRSLTNSIPLYLQLQQDLENGGSNSRSGSRGGNEETVKIDVQPLGEQYAIVVLPSNSPNNLTQQIRQQSYVENTLPVLSLSQNQAENSQTVVLPNEILVSFDPDLSEPQIQSLLNRYHLEVIRPLQFTPNNYLVRSQTQQGTEILNVANSLTRISGIESATPNFIQSLNYTVEDVTLNATATTAKNRLQQAIASLPKIKAEFESELLPLAWHLNSTAQRGQYRPRTDIRATEAWKHSNGGEGVVVAVLDSLIQWDHPDLAENLHTVTNVSNLLPGETHGWDFTSKTTTCQSQLLKICMVGDPDTRVSDAELSQMRPHFQNTFQLSDEALLQEYSRLAQDLKQRNSSLSASELANQVRERIRRQIAAEFHGTWSAGVILAQPEAGQGAVGVAPKAKLLPVRVFGLNGEITTARLIEAIGYAAERDVDVINLSLGRVLPHQALADQVFRIIDRHPNLVIVASAGNNELDGVSFPAAIPGVISVGATSREGKRSFYSSYGGRLDVMAPGGETELDLNGGILTTGGTWVDGFWQGITVTDQSWGVALDPLGQYVQVQGTSFSAPTVAGVVALMRGVNPRLNRDSLMSILKETASYEALSLSQSEINRYRLQKSVGLTAKQDRLSGVFPLPEAVSAEQYFFGNGLVNAEAAVKKAQDY
jgi:subtilisin family serine protease